jgi:hypothetical protein
MASSRALQAALTIDDLHAPVWDQQEEHGETAEQYAMFLCYRNMKPAERSIAGAWRVWTKDTAQEGTSQSSAYFNLAKQMAWEERAAAHDISQLQARYREWGQRDWLLREEVWTAGSELYRKAMVALEKIVDDNLSLGISEVANLLKVSTEIRRDALPNITQLNAAQIRDVLSAMPADKRERILRIVVSENNNDNPQPTITVRPPPTGRTGRPRKQVDDDIVEGEIIAPAAKRRPIKSKMRSPAVEAILAACTPEERQGREMAVPLCNSPIAKHKVLIGELDWRTIVADGIMLTDHAKNQTQSN